MRGTPKMLAFLGTPTRPYGSVRATIVSESADIVAATAARIFADLADPQVINSSADDCWKPKLWQALTQTGLTLAWAVTA